MSAHQHILPGNATPFERALSETGDFLPSLGPQAETIRGAKLTGIPDSFVPFLIWEYGLGELLPYLTDPRRAIAEGIGWQRVRGTPASLVQALDWIDVVAAIEEGDPDRARWYWYQLGLAEPASFADVDRIVGISDISAPVRSHLIRLHAGLDLRAIRFESHRFDGAGLVEDWSGLRLKPEWPVLSFGATQGDETQSDAINLSGAHLVVIATRTYLGGLRFDVGRLDDEVVEPGYRLDGATILVAAVNSTSQGGAAWPNEAWPSLAWGDIPASITQGGVS